MIKIEIKINNLIHTTQNAKKKNIVKETTKKSKKTISKKQEPLTLVDEEGILMEL